MFFTGKGKKLKQNGIYVNRLQMLQMSEAARAGIFKCKHNILLVANMCKQKLWSMDTATRQHVVMDRSTRTHWRQLEKYTKTFIFSTYYIKFLINSKIQTSILECLWSFDAQKHFWHRHVSLVEVSKLCRGTEFWIICISLARIPKIKTIVWIILFVQCNQN